MVKCCHLALLVNKFSSLNKMLIVFKHFKDVNNLFPEQEKIERNWYVYQICLLDSFYTKPNRNGLTAPTENVSCCVTAGGGKQFGLLKAPGFMAAGLNTLTELCQKLQIKAKTTNLTRVVFKVNRVISHAYLYKKEVYSSVLLI